MNYSRHLFIVLGAVPPGIIHFGQLPPLSRNKRIFTWRNFLRRPPNIKNHPDSPLHITNPRYYSFWSIGSAIGGELRFVIQNRSDKHVHSYTHRRYSPVSYGNGAYGSQPEGGLSPGKSSEHSVAARDYVELTLTIDYVQFTDGASWFSGSPDATVKAAGVKAGAKAAATHLLNVLERDGAEAVMAGLRRIGAEVRGPLGSAAAPDFGSFGFSKGVTKMRVEVQHAYEEGGLGRVEAVLRSFAG